MTDDLARFDAVALAALIRAGELHPSELLEITIERIERIDPSINAVIHRAFDEARAAISHLADGPFRGVPMLIKDLWPAEAGQPHWRGVRALQRADYRADHDSNLVAEYRKAGFVLCGRTNTPELGLGATTEPLATGPSRNPWDLTRGPGGSSGGAAAAVAAGIVPVANASDGGGSIRIPAAMCGLVGLKPSRGRVSFGPRGEEWGHSVNHVVSHTVRDSAAILDATSHHYPGDGVIAPGPDRPYAELIGEDPGRLRIGMLTTPVRAGLTIDAEVKAAVEQTARHLEGLGHHVTESSPDTLHDEALITRFGPMFAANAARELAEISATVARPLTDDDVEPWTRFIADRGADVSGVAVINAQHATTAFRRGMARWWADGFDLLLAPTCLRPAPLLGEMAPDNDDMLAVQNTTLHYSSLTQPFNVTGQPAISLPLAQTESGLPIGVQFVADYGREDLLLQLAAQLEADYRWSDHRAPLHA